MGKIKTISYGKSFEVVTPIGTVWEKIGLEAELGERETAEEGLLELKSIVEQFHVEHSGQEIPPQDTFTTVPGTKKDKRVPDLAVRVKYAKAASEMDEETIAKLESEYQF